MIAENLGLTGLVLFVLSLCLGFLSLDAKFDSKSVLQFFGIVSLVASAVCVLSAIWLR